MNKDILLELLKQDIKDLQKIAAQFDNQTRIHPLEIDLCANRLKSITEVLELITEHEKQQLERVQKAEDKVEVEVEDKDKVVNEVEVKVEVDDEVEVEVENEVEKAKVSKKVSEKEIEKESQEREKTISEKKSNKVLGEELVSNKKSLFDVLAESKDGNDLASQFKSGKLADINKGIPLNDKIWFIKELFNGESEKYQSCIQNLNQFSTIDQASAYMNQEFNWDPDSKSVQKFLRIISRRYL